LPLGKIPAGATIACSDIIHGKQTGEVTVSTPPSGKRYLFPPHHFLIATTKKAADQSRQETTQTKTGKQTNVKPCNGMKCIVMKSNGMKKCNGMKSYQFQAL